MIPARGRVYRTDLGYGLKPFLIVSNNRRNGQLDSALAVRMTTSMKPSMTSIVRLSSADHPFVGSVLCDDIVQIYRDELKEDLGALSAGTMQAVARGLAHALGI